jgi:hypothetical protein
MLRSVGRVYRFYIKAPSTLLGPEGTGSMLL